MVTRKVGESRYCFCLFTPSRAHSSTQGQGLAPPRHGQQTGDRTNDTADQEGTGQGGRRSRLGLDSLGQCRYPTSGDRGVPVVGGFSGGRCGFIVKPPRSLFVRGRCWGEGTQRARLCGLRVFFTRRADRDENPFGPMNLRSHSDCFTPEHVPVKTLREDVGL